MSCWLGKLKHLRRPTLLIRRFLLEIQKPFRAIRVMCRHLVDHLVFYLSDRPREVNRFLTFFAPQSLKRSTFQPLLEAIVMQSVVESNVLQCKLSLLWSFNYYAWTCPLLSKFKRGHAFYLYKKHRTYQLESFLNCYFGRNLVSSWQPWYGLQFHSC